MQFEIYTLITFKASACRMHACPMTCLAMNEDHLILSGSSLGGVTVSGLSSDQQVAILRKTGSACESCLLILISHSHISVRCHLCFSVFDWCVSRLYIVFYVFFTNSFHFYCYVYLLPILNLT